MIITLSPEGSPTAHHPAGPLQPDAGAGKCSSAPVPGLRRPRAHGHLEEERSQSARQGPAVLPAGAWKPSDPEYQGGLTVFQLTLAVSEWL